MNEPGTSPITAGPTPGPAELALMPPPVSPEEYLSAAQWGMASFLLSDVALFGTLIMAYFALMGRDTVPPTPAEALSLPLVMFTTLCLLSSSATIHFAEAALKKGRHGAFCLLWTATIVLGVIFLAGTAYEWYELIHKHHLTISRNLFGTSYYTLVGFHAAHVTSGVIIMAMVLGLALRRQLTEKNHAGIQLVSWYWHFVDVVWVVVFTVVYLVPKLMT